jgi:hypothetical protein
MTENNSRDMSMALAGPAGISLIDRREIEARITAPLLEAFSEEFGRGPTLDLAAGVVERLARDQGEQFARVFQGRSLTLFGKAVELWSQGGALEIEMLEQTEESVSFNVTRCKYAEMYRGLGIAEFGRVLSCSRDFALVKGFNPDIELKRTQTIMEGAPYCDFRFKKR